MAVNILSKRVAEVADLPCKNPDGSPMVDDAGNPSSATVFGPGTKIWQVADAAKKRKGVKRTREANGKTEAYFDNEVEDIIEFLCAITKRFNNMEIEGFTGSDKDFVRAVYSDPLLGYIRDHMDADTRNWENFTKASLSLLSFGSDNQPG